MYREMRARFYATAGWVAIKQIVQSGAEELGQTGKFILIRARIAPFPRAYSASCDAENVSNLLERHFVLEA